MAPGNLVEVLAGIYEGTEDAGVLPLGPGTGDDTVLVQTVDFITPVLDDPYAFGQAAAANALSDLYAMGARPIAAMNIVGFPAALLDQSGATRGAGPETLAGMLRGGRAKVEEAGAQLLGGHTVDDAEPKYGLAATGLARRSELLLQSGARPGDALVLTKPIGGGVLSTALRRDGLAPAVLEELTRVLTALNATASAAARTAKASAATDVTGFGLLGHLSNLVVASGVRAEIAAEAVPILGGVVQLAQHGCFPGGARRNLSYVTSRLTLSFASGVEPWQELLLADPMTSGGLLLAVSEDKVGELLREGRANGQEWSRIGRLTAGSPAIRITLH